MLPHECFEELDLIHYDLVCGGRDFGPGWRSTVWDDGSELHTNDNGARLGTNPDGSIFNWGAPRVTGDMDPQTVRDNAQWWNNFRDENALNKVGPDGQEHLPQYRFAGQDPNVQQFAGTHDIYSAEAYRQALANGSPQRLEQYQEAVEDSALWGGIAAATEGPREGARRANDIFAEYEFYIEP